MKTVTFNIFRHGIHTAEIKPNAAKGILAANKHFNDYENTKVRCIGQFDDKTGNYIIYESYIDSGSNDYYYFAVKN